MTSSRPIQCIVRGLALGPCARILREASLVGLAGPRGVDLSQQTRSLSSTRGRDRPNLSTRTSTCSQIPCPAILSLGSTTHPSSYATRRTISLDSTRMQHPVVATNVTPASRSRLVLSRTMTLIDAQIFGTIHGGVVMDMMEEAGTIFSKQYCQSLTSEGSDEMRTVSGYLEKAEFIQPMFVGNLAEVHAEVGYSSKHSLQVVLSVYASSEDNDERRLTNRSIIWYVPVRKTDEGTQTILPVPSFTDYPSEEAKLRGLKSYETMKLLRADALRRYPTEPLATWMGGIRGLKYSEEQSTVDFSHTLFLKAISPIDCWPGEQVGRGGPVLKLIDDVACIVAAQHCYHYCITVGVDSTFLFKGVSLGNCLVASAKVIFASSRAVEIKVDVDEQTLDTNQVMLRKRAAESIITCLSLDESYQSREMAPIKIKTKEEQQLFDERKHAYEERKKLAAAKRASKLIEN